MPNSPNINIPLRPSKEAELAARCHEIQTGLGLIDVPEFEQLQRIGMAVRLALHFRGLAAVNYETLKLVANYYLGIPVGAVRSILDVLAEVEFVKLQTEGKTIKAVIPNVPYYESLYSTLGTYAGDAGFNEAEQLSVELLSRLSRSPEKIDRLRTKTGADSKLFDRALDVGQKGSYLRLHRSRGRDIALSPTYFSENAEIFADMVAGAGSNQVKKLMAALHNMQGVPLSIIRKQKEIAGTKLSSEELNLLIRLAQDGAVKPPSITTSYSGEQFFLFTPTPSGAALVATKRDIYEKAMAIVAAVRQGQFLPSKYAIRKPGAVLYRLRENLQLAKATTEATQQYKKLVHLRVARLVNAGGGFHRLEIIDTPENREALSIAYDLVDAGVAAGTEVDEEARKALQQEHSFVESLVASGELQRREKVDITPDQQMEMENLWLK